MNVRKTIIPLLLVLVMILTLTACGNSATASNSTNSGNEPSAATNTKDFVSLTYHVLGDSKIDQLSVEAEINKILKEKINAEFTVKWLGWTDYFTKYNLLLASGEPIDLIHGASTWLDLWKNAQRDAFMPLNDLLPTYAPQTYANTTPAEWEECSFNGNIVAVPGNHYKQYINHGFIYREDWNKAFGYEPIRDVAGWEAYCQGIVDNAGGDMIPAGCVPWDVKGGPGDTGLWTMFYNSNGRQWQAVAVPGVVAKSYEEPYTLIKQYDDDIIVEFAKKAVEWADRGFWVMDVMNNDSANSDETMKANMSGLRQHHVQTYEGRVADWNRYQYQEGFELGMFMWSDMTGKIVMDPITHDTVSLGKNSKNPERAIMLIEVLREDKAAHQLLRYGIDGRQYVIDENGKRAEAPGYDKATMEYESNAWAIREDKYEIPSVFDWEGKFEMRAERCDPKAVPYLYGRWIFNQEPVDAEFTAVQEAINANLPAIHFGKAGDPVAAVEKMRQEIKNAGIDKLYEEAQKQMDAFKTSIGK